MAAPIIVSYQMNLAANAKRLSDVYGGPSGNPDPTLDVPYRWLILQAEGADIFLGDSTVTQTKYGCKLSAANVRDATGHLGPFGSGVVRLSDFYACGPSATIHIFGVRF